MHLIANRWYAVLSSRALGSQPLAARRFGLELVFWRKRNGQVAVAHDECPHRRAKLSPGKVVDDCIECPFHGFRYDAAGTCTAIPAHPERPIPKAMSVPTLRAREAHDLIWVWTGPDAAPDRPVPFFDDLTDWSWRGSEFEVEVNTHYTRAIENQLDYTHLPFVHSTTIGRFVTEKAMDVVTQLDGDRITAHLRDQAGRVEFVGPNIWRNETGPMWQFLAFVPVDETHMLYIVRTYQRMVKVPGLDWVMGKSSRVLNHFIMAQDTPVVESQPAGETRLEGGEILVPSDGPIIAYRRWREEHRRDFAPFGDRSVVAKGRLVEALHEAS